MYLKKKHKRLLMFWFPLAGRPNENGIIDLNEDESALTINMMENVSFYFVIVKRRCDMTFFQQKVNFSWVLKASQDLQGNIGKS